MAHDQQRDYTLIEDLCAQATPPDDGIVSRTILATPGVKAVLFGFAAGQELSEHTASVPAILQFVKGEAVLTLGDQVMNAQAGTWVHMPAGLEHSIRATTPVVMTLLMLKKASPSAGDH